MEEDLSLIHIYDIVRELYEDEEVTDVQSIYKDIGEYLINSEKLNNSKSFELGAVSYTHLLE